MLSSFNHLNFNHVVYICLSFPFQSSKIQTRDPKVLEQRDAGLLPPELGDDDGHGPEQHRHQLQGQL